MAVLPGAIEAGRGKSGVSAMPKDIRAFFDSYRDAFNRLDGHAVSAHYDTPAMIAHPGGNGVFADVEALNANNIALCAQYANSGFIGADFEERTFVTQGKNFSVADLAWKITRKDQSPQCFNTTYALSCREGNWKVFCVTAYEEQRPMDRK